MNTGNVDIRVKIKNIIETSTKKLDQVDIADILNMDLRLVCSILDTMVIEKDIIRIPFREVK